jgi:tRNA U34 5-methylaminomethyl-2-thiouridine-forming methyltransferase MnmC
MIDAKIIETADGSSSIQSLRFNASYHSLHGALQESRHVFIQNGLDLFSSSKKVDVLEIGFGSGLNTLLAWDWALKHGIEINYVGIEAFPLSVELLRDFNAGEIITKEQFMQLHTCEWENKHQLSPEFSFQKKKLSWPQFESGHQFDIVFYDAFAPACQPELWETEALQCCVNNLRTGGIWVTYCAKGEVRRSVAELGCDLERLPGPPFKRHMLRATKR